MRSKNQADYNLVVVTIDAKLPNLIPEADLIIMACMLVFTWIDHGTIAIKGIRESIVPLEVTFLASIKVTRGKKS